MCSYIDDYSQFDIALSGGNAQCTAEQFLDLIGWKYSLKEAKRLPMSSVFSVRVEVDLRRTKFGEVVVRNKKPRVEQTCNDIDAILAEGHFPAALASSLRGRLQFAESQTFGRAVSLHMKACHSRATGSLPGTFISDDLLKELQWAKNFLVNDPPRLLRVANSKTCVVIFTDACLEEDDQTAGIGMVAMKCSGGEVLSKCFLGKGPRDRFGPIPKPHSQSHCRLRVAGCCQSC